MSAARSNARLVVGVSAGVVLAAIAVLAYFLLQHLFAARAALAEIEPLYARLLGLREVGPQVDAALAEVRATLARNAYPAATNPARIGTDLQQRVRRLAEAAGMSVIGSQILPERAAEGFSLIPVAATIEGNLDGLRKLLFALRGDSPAILVDSAVIQAAVRRRLQTQAAEDRLTVQLNLSVVHLQP